MISDERLEYIATTGNARGKDAQEMAKELLAHRKAWSEPFCCIEPPDLGYLADGDDARVFPPSSVEGGDTMLYRKPDTGEV